MIATSHRIVVADGRTGVARRRTLSNSTWRSRTVARHTVSTNVQFGSAGSVALKMDLYQLPRVAGRSRGALIFFNRATGTERQQPLWSGWARSAASRDLVGIVPDLRSGTEAQDFQTLVDYLVRHGTELGVDTAGIAVFAASGNVYTAFPLLEDPGRRRSRAPSSTTGLLQSRPFGAICPCCTYAPDSIVRA